MAKIKILKEAQLQGGTSKASIYPVTHTKAVYDSNNKSLDSTLQDISTDIQSKASKESIELLNAELQNKVGTDEIYDKATIDSKFSRIDEIKEEVNSQITAIIDNAPEKFDTLKEIADWIASDESKSAEIISDINNINNSLDKKQDTLVAGDGIIITKKEEKNVIQTRYTPPIGLVVVYGNGSLSINYGEGINLHSSIVRTEDEAKEVAKINDNIAPKLEGIPPLAYFSDLYLIAAGSHSDENLKPDSSGNYFYYDAFWKINRGKETVLTVADTPELKDINSIYIDRLASEDLDFIRELNEGIHGIWVPNNRQTLFKVYYNNKFLTYAVCTADYSNDGILMSLSSFLNKDSSETEEIIKFLELKDKNFYVTPGSGKYLTALPRLLEVIEQEQADKIEELAKRTQPKLTAGNNINIVDDVISAEGGSVKNVLIYQLAGEGNYKFKYPSNTVNVADLIGESKVATGYVPVDTELDTPTTSVPEFSIFDMLGENVYVYQVDGDTRAISLWKVVDKDNNVVPVDTIPMISYVEIDVLFPTSRDLNYPIDIIKYQARQGIEIGTPNISFEQIVALTYGALYVTYVNATPKHVRNSQSFPPPITGFILIDVFPLDGSRSSTTNTGVTEEVVNNIVNNQLTDFNTMIQNKYQEKLTAGEGIKIENNIISSTIEFATDEDIQELLNMLK